MRRLVAAVLLHWSGSWAAVDLEPGPEFHGREGSTPVRQRLRESIRHFIGGKGRRVVPATALVSDRYDDAFCGHSVKRGRGKCGLFIGRRPLITQLLRSAEEARDRRSRGLEWCLQKFLLSLNSPSVAFTCAPQDVGL